MTDLNGRKDSRHIPCRHPILIGFTIISNTRKCIIKPEISFVVMKTINRKSWVSEFPARGFSPGHICPGAEAPGWEFECQHQFP